MKKKMNPEALARFEARLKEKGIGVVPANPKMLNMADMVGGTDAMMEALKRDVAKDLLDRCSRFLDQTVQQELAVGKLVQWKPGLCNRIGLSPSASVMIVTGMLDFPITDDEISISRIGGGEPLDTMVAAILPNPSVPGQMDFVEFMVDSRRLMVYEVPAEKEAATDAEA